jgi:hypothetical protein
LTIASQAQGDILYFNGTNWVRLAAGTANTVLQTNGASTDPFWGGKNQIFTSDGTFTAPTGITLVWLSGCGGGGGGAGGYDNIGGGGGGGGSTFFRVAYTVIAGNNYTVDIGAGGAGGLHDNAGINGANTTFNSVVMGNYGVKGLASVETPTGGAGGAAIDIAPDDGSSGASMTAGAGKSGYAVAGGTGGTGTETTNGQGGGGAGSINSGSNGA